jgi:diguanylate cyclase (GGDEF)-like protein
MRDLARWRWKVCVSGEIETVARFDLIKRLLVGAAISSSLISAQATAPAPLTNLESIHKLTNAEAAKSLPVDFKATVTYSNAFQGDLFVQDGSAGIYIWQSIANHLAPGDLVSIKGVTAPSFRPYVMASQVTLLGRSKLPQPKPVKFDNLIRAQFDSVLVTTRGIVRTANRQLEWAPNASGAILKILTDGGYVDVFVSDGVKGDLDYLLDAEVEVTGVSAGSFDGKRQQTGAALYVSNLSDIRIVKAAGVGPWSLPLTPLDQVLGVYHVQNRTSRVRVTGTVTYYEPGATTILQDGAKSLVVMTHSFAPVHIGDRADVIGFPIADEGFLSLGASEIRDLGVPAAIDPQPVTWRQLTSSKHIFELVSIEGQVVITARESAQDEYVLQADGYEFSAVIRHPEMRGQAPLQPMNEIPVGSRIRVTGICVPENAFLYRRNDHFNILLRTANDIAVIAGPSWMNARNGIRLAGFLLILVLAVGLRGWYLEHRNRREIGALAYVEKRRARILEDINHSKPLAGILERITELVSVRLNGAPCWCQIADGAALGNRPVQLSSSLRTAEHSIAARSGAPHGSIFAAFDAHTKPTAEENEALAMAAELATLAVETGRLYSDLVHRSEFDLLTDVQNRFAMDKNLRAHIHVARQTAGIFGLIYIDLNEFKQVNDVYGHQAGDQYLQELTRRMKGQLRPGDTLARLGGDEFAVLVSQVRNRADVEEIASRLVGCFDEPFRGEGYELQGSASIGIAVYPEDANSADSLLRAADAAMYAVKYTRPGKSRGTEASPSDFAPRN